MLFSRWPKRFVDLMQGGLPDTYLCIDTETTGFNMDLDLVVEIGHCLVSGGKVLHRHSVIVDWTGHDVVDEEWLHDRLARVAVQMAGGHRQRITTDLMRSEGLPPGRVFELYADLVSTCVGKGAFIVGHNHLAFDEKMLAHNVVGFEYADDFGFGPNVLDVHAMERAQQMSDDERTLPRADEDVRGYMKRMAHMKPRGGARVTSNLTPFCFNKYRLAERFGLDMRQAHRADFDAYATHLIVATWREQLAAGEPGATASRVNQSTESNAAPGKRARGQRNR